MTWKLYLLVILVVISTAMLGGRLRQKRQSREAAVLGSHEGKPVL